MPGAVALAKAVLITRDEHDLIDDFLAYYGEILGRENVVVVDNGSRDDGSPEAERVHAAYRAHMLAGGEVRVDTRPFGTALRFMSEHMRSLRGTCEFILPLETDEFLFLPGKETPDGGYAASREDVHAALRAIPPDVSIVRYGHFLGSCVDPADAGYEAGAYSRPAAQITRFHDEGWDKVIVRASEFEFMTQWSHSAYCRSGRYEMNGDIGLLHFDNPGSRRRVDRARAVAVSCGHLDPGAPLEEQIHRLHKLSSLPLLCGHKASQYLLHLRRLSVLAAFQTHVGRLPASADEMNEYVNAPHVVPREAVLMALEKGDLIASAGAADVCPDARHALLYSEGRTEGGLVFRQVANLLASIPPARAT